MLKKIINVPRRLFAGCLKTKKGQSLYFRLATFLSSRGFQPPLAVSYADMVNRWSIQGMEGSTDDPQTYAKDDRSLEELFKDVLPYLSKDSRILEIGCNVGRSLNYLYKKGFKDLTGIEIGSVAVEKSKVIFPEMAKNSKLIIGDAAKEIKKFEDSEFDLVFCHSVLVNIHPKHNSIFADMARVSSKFVLILENEGSFLAYPRDFKWLFEKNGMKMIVYKLFEGVCERLAVPFTSNSVYHNNTIRLFVKDRS